MRSAGGQRVTGSAQAVRTSAGSAAAVTAAGFAANLLSYAVLLAAVHALSPSGYGQIVVLLNVLLVGTVPSFAVQTVTARRVAVGDTAGTARATAVVALAASGLVVALSPALTAFLHLSHAGDLVLVGAALPGVTALGMYQGILQGQRRFTRLAAVLVLAAVGRSGFGLIGLLAGHGTTLTLAGTVVGTTACAILVGVRLRGILAPGRPAGPLREIAHALHAHGTFWFLSTLVLLLARHVLSSHLAAVYATGSVVTRAALWLPQSVATLVFAHLTDTARPCRRRRRGSPGRRGDGCHARPCCEGRRRRTLSGTRPLLLDVRDPGRRPRRAAIGHGRRTGVAAHPADDRALDGGRRRLGPGAVQQPAGIDRAGRRPRRRHDRPGCGGFGAAQCGPVAPGSARGCRPGRRNVGRVEAGTEPCTHTGGHWVDAVAHPAVERLDQGLALLVGEHAVPGAVGRASRLRVGSGRGDVQLHQAAVVIVRLHTLGEDLLVLDEHQRVEFGVHGHGRGRQVAGSVAQLLEGGAGGRVSADPRHGIQLRQHRADVAARRSNRGGLVRTDARGVVRLCVVRRVAADALFDLVASAGAERQRGQQRLDACFDLRREVGTVVRLGFGRGVCQG